MARPYDVIVYGASGFTGTLVSEYLATKYDGKARAILPSIKFTNMHVIVYNCNYNTQRRIALVC